MVFTLAVRIKLENNVCEVPGSTCFFALIFLAASGLSYSMRDLPRGPWTL